MKVISIIRWCRNLSLNPITQWAGYDSDADRWVYHSIQDMHASWHLMFVAGSLRLTCGNASDSWQASGNILVRIITTIPSATRQRLEKSGLVRASLHSLQQMLNRSQIERSDISQRHLPSPRGKSQIRPQRRRTDRSANRRHEIHG